EQCQNASPNIDMLQGIKRFLPGVLNRPDHQSIVRYAVPFSEKELRRCLCLLDNTAASILKMRFLIYFRIILKILLIHPLMPSVYSAVLLHSREIPRHILKPAQRIIRYTVTILFPLPYRSD